MKKIRVIFCVIIFITGLGIASYPFISNMVAQRHASQVVKDYETNVEEMDEEKIDAMKEAAKKYNEQLSNVVSVDDENENNEQGESYVDLLNIGESLGYITIPKIDVNLPIYNGTSQDVLSKAGRSYGAVFVSAWRREYALCVDRTPGDFRVRYYLQTWTS